MTNADDRPTNPDELRPDSEIPDPSSNVMKAAKPLDYGVDDGRELRLPAEPSVLELAAFRIMQGVAKLNETDFSQLLRDSERRIEQSAKDREAARAKEIDTNLELISNEVRGLRGQIEALAPRVTALEDIPIQLQKMRERMDTIEREWAVIKAQYENAPRQ